MDFSLSEEQKQVQDLINQFIAKDYPFDVREKLVKSEDGFSKEYWKTFGEFGLLAMPFPEDDGGFNGGPVDLMVILEDSPDNWLGIGKTQDNVDSEKIESLINQRNEARSSKNFQRADEIRSTTERGGLATTANLRLFSPSFSSF